MSSLTYSTGEKLYYQKQPSTNLMRLYLLGAEVIPHIETLLTHTVFICLARISYSSFPYECNSSGSLMSQSIKHCSSHTCCIIVILTH
nr:MAG TPA: hypothetical protein [Caudoviricetes sp.]